MAVWLAVQVLSNSVKDSLLYLQNGNFIGFENVGATAEFHGVFNEVFDLLNCRSKFPSTRKQPWRLPLTDDNYDELKAFAQRMIEYIRGLTNSAGIKLIHYGRKCGFIGLIICLENLFHLYNFPRQKYSDGFSYLPSYKLLQ